MKFKKIEVIFDGRMTTATDGKTFVNVNCCSGDDYSEEVGAIEAIKKWYHQWPQNGDIYYYITSHGNVFTNKFNGENHGKVLREIGNFFKTEEEAKKAVERVKAALKKEG